MIEKIIHQVFISDGETTIEDYPLFIDNKKKWESWCADNDFQYKYHTDLDIYKYLTPEQLFFYDNLKFKWCKIDFSRYIILNHYGGVYIDLDIEPIPNVDFASFIENQKYILNKWYNPKTIQYELTNGIMGFPKGYLFSLIQYSMSQYNEKLKMEVYKTWQIRFMLQTTGVRMFKRWCRMNRLTYTENIHDYVKDHCTATWLKDFK